MTASKQSASENGREGNAVTSTSHSLLVRLKQHDPESWDRLVTLYAPMVFFWCRKLRLAEHDIPDVVQEVFQAVAKGIDRFRLDRPEDSFRGWLRTITRSKAMDLFRRQSRQPATAAGGSEALQRLTQLPATDPSDTADASDATENLAIQDLFQRACNLIRTDFQTKTWQAFWRCVVDGRTPADVAAELSMRPGTVRVAKSRVLQRLRQELGEALD